VVADAAFAFDLDSDVDSVALAPLLCGGLIGWRSLVRDQARALKCPSRLLKKVLALAREA